MKSTLLSLAAMAASTTALLVPPTVSVADADFWDGASPIMTGHTKATVYLDCPSCPIAIGTSSAGSPSKWLTGADTELLLELTSRDGSIFLNEMPIFPPSPQMQPISAKQVSVKHPWTHREPLYDGPIPLSTSIEVHPHVEVDSLQIGGEHGDAFQTVPMRRLSVDVLGMDGKVVRLDTVEVRFREDTLEIFDVTTSAAAPFMAGPDACRSVLCRFFELVREKTARLAKIAGVFSDKLRAGLANKKKVPVPCSKGMHLKGGVGKFAGKFDEQGNFKGFRPASEVEVHSEVQPEGVIHHAHGHHAAHHRCRQGLLRALHSVAHFMKHWVLPVAMGIAAGMAVSGVGMLIGQIVVALWARARYGNRGYASLQDVRVVVLEDDEFESLPQYQDVAEPAPEYTDEKSEQL